MADKLSVFNEALVRIGASPVSTLEAPSAQGLAAVSLLDNTIDRCLAAFPWFFALREVVLSAPVTGAALSTEFPNEFQTPADGLRILGMRNREPYFLSGDKIYCGSTAPRLVYVRRVDPPMWSAHFTQWVVLELAATLAVTITDDRALAETMYGLAPQAGREARSVASMQTPPYIFDMMRYYQAAQSNPLGGA